MRNIRLTVLISIFSLCNLLAMMEVSAQGMGKISGVVRNSEDASPLSGANVLVEGTVLGATTGTTGRFVLGDVPQGVHRLSVSRVGFQRKIIEGVAVSATDTVTLEISLIPLPIQSEAVVVTASKRDQSLAEIPVSVSLLDSKSIDMRNSVTIDDALRYIPGVNMVQSQVNIRGMSGYSRGIGSRVLLLIDGLPLLTGDTGEITWETIPTSQIDRVEVVKGAGSALYGSSALGGVINVITKEIKEGAEIRYRAYVGMYDSPFYDDWRWSDKTRFLNGMTGSYSKRSDQNALLFSAGRTNDDGFRENDFFRRWNAYGRYKHDFSPYETVTLSLNFLHQRKGSFFWWKNLSRALQSDGDQSAFHITATRWNTNVSYRNFVTDKFFYTVRGVYFSSFFRNDSAGVEGTSSKAHKGIVELQANYSPSLSNTVTFGVVGSYNDIGSELYGSHGDIGGALYFQDEVRFEDQLRLTGGARFDFVKVFGLDAASRLSPKFGIVYSPDRETAIRASVGHGFRAPSIGEIYISAATYAALVVPNTSLKPEHSWSYEVGGSRLLYDRVLLDASLFWSEFSDLIEGRVSFDVNRNQPEIKFENVTRARIQGAEISAKSDWFSRRLHLEVGYTYVWPKDLKDNQVLRFRPRHLLYTGATFTRNMLSFGADFRYISRVDQIDDNLVQLAPIQDGRARVAAKVFDVRAALDLSELGPPMVLRVNVNNVFQYNYVELIGNVAPIRNFVFSVEGKF